MSKVYITKWALTAGIKIRETDSDTNGTMIGVKEASGYRSCFHGNEWYATPEEAVARAEEMRLKRIACLEKSLKRIRSLTFDLTSPKE